MSSLIDRGFRYSRPSAPAYVRTYEGWLYLAVVIDLFSRRVVGWSIQSSLHTDIVLTALTMTRGSGCQDRGCCCSNRRATGRALPAVTLGDSAPDHPLSIGDSCDQVLARSIESTLAKRRKLIMAPRRQPMLKPI